MKYCDGRDEQFRKIGSLRKSYENSSNPIISVDAKKKEQIGNFYREGTVYAKEPIQTYVTTKKEAPMQERKSTTLDEAIQPREEPPEQMFE